MGSDLNFDPFGRMGMLILPGTCISFIIGPTGLGCEGNLYEIICPESLVGLI